MKIAIINDVHVGKPLECKGVIRAASHLAQEALPRLLKKIVQLHQPDLIVNLGDLIRSESKEYDLKLYRQALVPFQSLNCPVLHLLGNHDIKQMSTSEVEKLWQAAGFQQKSYGIQEINGLAIIWLGIACQPEREYKHTLPEIQVDWLRDTLRQLKMPALIFTHCAIDDQDVNGNFFYEGYELKDKRGFFLENYPAIQTLISDSNSVLMVIQAHLHYFHSKLIDQVPYITCPAMGDNICGPTSSEHIPDIYTLLTLTPELSVLKAYAQEYCFAGCEYATNLNKCERFVPP